MSRCELQQGQVSHFCRPLQWAIFVTADQNHFLAIHRFRPVNFRWVILSCGILNAFELFIELLARKS